MAQLLIFTGGCDLQGLYSDDLNPDPMGMLFAELRNAMLQPISQRERRFKEERGFTLLEVMVVVAIVGLAAALAQPNFQQMYAKYELYQTTTALYNRLIFARSAAISRNAMIVATPSNLSSGQGQVTFTAPLTAEPFPLNVGFVLPLPISPIGFTPRGLSTLPLATQTIQLKSLRNPTLIYTISVQPSGKVTWCRMAINPCVLNATS